MTIDILIRPVREDELEELGLAIGFGPTGVRHWWAEIKAGYRETFVAVLEGRIVATVNINEQESYPGILHLFALATTDSLQKKGIATQLIAFVEAEAHTRGHTGVYLDVGLTNPNAQRLYERLGYVPDGPTYENRWSRTDPDGTQHQQSESVYRMFKHFA